MPHWLLLEPLQPQNCRQCSTRWSRRRSTKALLLLWFQQPILIQLLPVAGRLRRWSCQLRLGWQRRNRSKPWPLMRVPDDIGAGSPRTNAGDVATAGAPLALAMAERPPEPLADVLAASARLAPASCTARRMPQNGHALKPCLPVSCRAEQLRGSAKLQSTNRPDALPTKLVAMTLKCLLDEMLKRRDAMKIEPMTAVLTPIRGQRPRSVHVRARLQSACMCEPPTHAARERPRRVATSTSQHTSRRRRELAIITRT